MTDANRLLTPETLMAFGEHIRREKEWPGYGGVGTVVAHADAWEADIRIGAANYNRACNEAEQRIAALRVRVEALGEAKALAFKMQQAALAAYAADDGHTVDLAWLVNMTTRLLELMQ